MAASMFNLLQMFQDDEAVTGMESYRTMAKVFSQQCEIVPVGEGTEAQLKEPKEVPSDSVQNPSDPDATYDGHKGQGYQAQLVETCVPDRKPGEPKPLNLVLFAEAEPAHLHDSHALVPAMNALAENGVTPSRVLADTSYESSQNQHALEGMGINLLAPAPGKISGAKKNSEETADGAPP